MTRSEYERTCYLIGIKPIDISDELKLILKNTVNFLIKDTLKKEIE